ncbi:MAG: caspase family protein [Acidobacteria bacterium]|nr:caspase family protein [Acidobacteriota bacterium]
MRPVAVACLFGLLASSSARAQIRDLKYEAIEVQRKLALVIGNGAYPKAPLKNPVNDAVSMGAVLKRLGFQVTEGRDLTLRRIDQMVGQFAGAVRQGDLALVFFAGHGMQVQLENYLVPVDFDFKSDSDVKYDAYPASKLRDKLESSGARLRILILDACRNNPFRGSRTASRGLAPMQSDAEGTLIAFATGEGNVALDNIEESNGLFTKHLIAALPTPGLSIEEVFKKVKEDVYRASGRKQNPFTYDNIVGRYYPVSAPLKTPDPLADTALQLEYRSGTPSRARTRRPCSRTTSVDGPAASSSASPKPV